MMGQLESVGRVDATYDYHAHLMVLLIFQRSELPFLITEFGEEFKRECIQFLNMFIELVRYNSISIFILLKSAFLF